MARKSAWQQFADNFDSTYKTFNTMFSDIEEGRIMSEEPEELQSGIGPGPRSQYQASYGGQIYNEKITPEKLRGLRNQRLIDNMNKWGDTEGAMKMQLDQATLRNQNAAADLAEGQLKDRIANSGLQNKALLASIGLTEAQIEEVKTLLPHKQTEYILNAIAKRSDNRVKIATEGDDISKSGSLASSAASQAEIDKITEQERRLTSSSKVSADIAANEASQSTSGLTKKSNKVEMGELDQQIAVNDMMANFRTRASKAPDMGGFADNKAAKEWMISEMKKININLAEEMQKNYGANELAQVTQESTLFTEKALSAFQKGGIDVLAKTIDDLNGLNGTEIVYEDTKQGRIATLYEKDQKGNLLRPIASGDLEGGSFLMSLRQTLDPARAMEISKEHFDNLKTQADLEYTAAQKEYTEAATKKIGKETEQLGKAAPLNEKEYFVSRLQADPNDKVALYGLLGMDMTREEIDDMVDMEAVRMEDERVKNSQGGPERDKDGLGAGKTRGDQETKVVVNAGFSNIEGVTQVDETASLKEQAKQKTQAKLDIKKRVEKVFDVIKDDYIPRTLDSSLSKKDFDKQKIRDAAVDWVKSNRQYFYEFPGELAAFEADPEGWVQAKIKSKGLGGK